MENYEINIRICGSEGQDSLEILAEQDGTPTVITLSAKPSGVSGLTFRPENPHHFWPWIYTTMVNSAHPEETGPMANSRVSFPKVSD